MADGRPGDVYLADQRGATPLRDNIGRDQNNYAARRTQIDGWLDRLEQEVRDDIKVRMIVESLQYYHDRTPDDDIVGLEAKLSYAGRNSERKSALRKKEAFSKLLAEWQAYPTAQEVFAYFLSKLDADFNASIVPLLPTASASEINAAFKTLLVDPVLAEMGCGPFMLNHMNVSGMVYWLAEQCYIRWHA